MEKVYEECVPGGAGKQAHWKQQSRAGSGSGKRRGHCFVVINDHLTCQGKQHAPLCLLLPSGPSQDAGYVARSGLLGVRNGHLYCCADTRIAPLSNVLPVGNRFCPPPTSVVSLTGGIASGKSTASKAFSAHGIPLIDLDVIARQVVEPHDASRTLDKLVAHFGRDILLADGTLNRAELGRRAFGAGKERERKVLNKHTHSAVRKRMAWLLFKYWVTGTPIVIVDTPLAVEAGLWRLCGEMVLVWACVLVLGGSVSENKVRKRADAKSNHPPIHTARPKHSASACCDATQTRA